MADLIDRDDLMRKHTTSFLHNNRHNTVAELQVLLKLINEQPTVDAVPVVHGHWLKATGMMPPEWFGRHVCSVCDNFAPAEFRRTHEWLSPICPNCGAKMDRKDDEQK